MSVELNIFEQATRDKVRFSYKGQLSIEDLWDLRVEDLDIIYRQLNKELKAANEDSLLQKPTIESAALSIKVEIVKRIVAVKLAEADECKAQAKKRVERQKIQAILAEKQDEGLKGKTEAELLELLKEL